MLTFNDFFNTDLTPKWEFIEAIPEFDAMKGCEHSKHWHIEGDPWEHTKLVVNNAVMLVNNKSKFIYKCLGNKFESEALLMAALFHDIAKPAVTKWDEAKQDWTAPFHAEVGSKMTRRILFDWNDLRQRELIVSLVRNHMVMHHILEQTSDSPVKLYRFCSEDVGSACSYELAAALCYCDDGGSICLDEPFVYKQVKARRIHDRMYKLYENGFQAATPQKLIAQNHYYNKDINGYLPRYDFKVYVMIGLPGSGKSTWCKDQGLPVVSRDIARVELGFCKEGEKYLGDKQEEDVVTKYVNEKILRYAAEKTDFIIDNTHLKQKYRDGIHKLLEGKNAEFIYVYVEAPTLMETIKRREEDGFGSGAKMIISNMLEGFEFPFPYEYDRLIFWKQR